MQKKLKFFSNPKSSKTKTMQLKYLPEKAVAKVNPYSAISKYIMQFFLKYTKKKRLLNTDAFLH